jgi:hypothetical protein
MIKVSAVPWTGSLQEGTLFEFGTGESDSPAPILPTAMPQLRNRILIWVFAATTGCLISSCGFSSVSPFVSGADVAYDPKLVGTFGDSEGKESVVVVREGEGYDITYDEGKGKTARFHGVLGRLGSRRVLDVIPKEPPLDQDDLYQGLVVPTHGLIIIDSLDNGLTYRVLDPEAIKRILNANPSLVAHIVDRGLTAPQRRDRGVLLTASTRDVRRFLSEIIDRPGMLSDAETWRRK